MHVYIAIATVASDSDIGIKHDLSAACFCQLAIIIISCITF